MQKFIEVTIDNNPQIPLLQWVLEHYPNLNHSITQKLIRTAAIKLNGKKAKFSTIVNKHDIIKLPIEFINSFIPAPKKVTKSTVNPALYKKEISLLLNSILYQDDDYLILNKPAGLAMQGGTKVYFHLALALPFLKLGKSHSPYLVHRLDKDTSGVLILARNKETSQYMFEVFKQKRITKIYNCLVYPFINQEDTGIIKANLLKQGATNSEQIVIDSKGKEAITKYKVLQKKDKIALLEVEPQTGRTHQIRVHMAQVLHAPIIGDFKYGAKPLKIGIDYHRLYLHAKSIEFQNAMGKTIKITAPLPETFVSTLQKLGFTDK
ncbi:Ribosomal large subunit pseudouridine synthase C [Candidatus Hepatincola sp. Pdp]